MNSRPITPKAFESSFGMPQSSNIPQPAFGNTILDELRNDLAAQHPDIFQGSSPVSGTDTDNKGGQSFLSKLLSFI